MKITILKDDDGYWLSLDGNKKALINIGEHGPIVTSAVIEAVEKCLLMDESITREKLAEYAHKAWSGWMDYLFEKSIPYKPGEIQAYKGAVIIPEWAVKRWKRQAKTHYAELPENEKESDRKEADSMLKIIL